ncbi:PIG-L family deacetylase [Nocardioides sp. GXQ0305]|uniref:PIG-L family deacetylase n=1 Tax=Nocardioides sp. GXQ0305 TaxID=3423912 RepID=UPI003D7CCDA9
MRPQPVDFRHDVAGTPAAAWDPIVEGLPRRDVLVDGAGVPVERVVVVSAHPDDETLGAGGLLARASHGSEAGISVIALTSGEGSHPGSPTNSRDMLAARRRREGREALEQLGRGITLEYWRLADGGVAAVEQACVERLTDHVGDGRRTLLVAPWRHDGHPDHEAAGRAAAAAAVRTGARLLEYPVWAWHWLTPDPGDWTTAVALPLDRRELQRKQHATACHRSQVAPLSELPGDETLLGPDVLAHFARPVEVFLAEPADDPALDRLHVGGAEPWGADVRWYEERKRALTLAVLPRRRFDRVLDVGCSTGVTTRALAERCRRLVAVDRSAAAVRTSRQRLADLEHVSVEQRQLPEEWPDGSFDLVVVSEVGYFLSPAALDRLVERVVGSLAPSGVVLLCHWRHPVVGWVLDGETVHGAFGAAVPGERLASYDDRDVSILLLGPGDQMPDPLW